MPLLNGHRRFEGWHALTDEQVEQLKIVFEDDPVTNALFVILRDTGARLAEVASLRVTDYNTDEGHISGGSRTSLEVWQYAGH